MTRRMAEKRRALVKVWSGKSMSKMTGGRTDEK